MCRTDLLLSLLSQKINCFIFVSGLRPRVSVWLRFSLKRQPSPTISPGTPPSMTHTWAKTSSTAFISRLTAQTAPWRLTVLESDPHPATLRARIQFRLNRDWTLRQQLRFWIQGRGSALLGLDLTLRAVGVRDRRTQDTVVRTNSTGIKVSSGVNSQNFIFNTEKTNVCLSDLKAVWDVQRWKNTVLQRKIC